MEQQNSGEGQLNNDVNQSNVDKETKNYQAALEIVKAVVGGEKNLAPKKRIDGDTTAQIVAELFAEEQETLRTSVKEGLRTILKKHVEIEAQIAEKEKEVRNLQKEKRKEFVKAANDWLEKIDKVAIMQDKYTEALNTAFSGETK